MIGLGALVNKHGADVACAVVTDHSSARSSEARGCSRQVKAPDLGEFGVKALVFLLQLLHRRC